MSNPWTSSEHRPCFTSPTRDINLLPALLAYRREQGEKKKFRRREKNAVGIYTEEMQLKLQKTGGGIVK